MTIRRFRRNWLAFVISIAVLGVGITVFVTPFNDWLAFSSLATLLLALVAFWTIWDNRQTRREERKREHTAHAADELCAWAEETLRLYYLPYDHHKDEIKDGLSNIMVKNMVMVIAATIIGDEFIEPTKRAETALAKYYEVVRDMYYKGVIKLPKDTVIRAELEDAFYSLLSYLYVLRYRDYDYHRFLDDAIENGKLKSKYQLRDGGNMDKTAGDKTGNTNTDDTLVKLSKKVEDSERGAWFRFLISLGFAMLAIGLAIVFSSPEHVEPRLKSALSIAILAVAIVVIVRTVLWYSPQNVSKNLSKGSMVTLSLGALIMMIDALLKTECTITVPFLLLSGIAIILIGFILTVVILSKLGIRI